MYLSHLFFVSLFRPVKNLSSVKMYCLFSLSCNEFSVSFSSSIEMSSKDYASYSGIDAPVWEGVNIET